MKKTLHEIKAEIDAHNKSIEELQNTIRDYQKQCPHPDFFVKVEQRDIEDDSGGPGIYEYTTIKYTCSLCEGNFYSNYDKNNANRPTLKYITDSESTDE
jgi:hypothetical protein